MVAAICARMINIYGYVWEMYADKILSDNSWRIQVCVTYIVTTGSRIGFHVIKFPPKAPVMSVMYSMDALWLR